MDQVTVLPRVQRVESMERVPETVAYRVEAAGNKFQYAWNVLRSTLYAARSALHVHRK